MAENDDTREKAALIDAVNRLVANPWQASARNGFRRSLARYRHSVVAAERARVVAWLRGLSGGKEFASTVQLSEKRQWEFDRATAWMDAADAIERGAHTKETA